MSYSIEITQEKHGEVYKVYQNTEPNENDIIYHGICYVTALKSIIKSENLTVHELKDSI